MKFSDCKVTGAAAVPPLREAAWSPRTPRVEPLVIEKQGLNGRRLPSFHCNVFHQNRVQGNGPPPSSSPLTVAPRLPKAQGLQGTHCCPLSTNTGLAHPRTGRDLHKRPPSKARGDRVRKTEERRCVGQNLSWRRSVCSRGRWGSLALQSGCISLRPQPRTCLSLLSTIEAGSYLTGMLWGVANQIKSALNTRQWQAPDEILETLSPRLKGGAERGANH